MKAGNKQALARLAKYPHEILGTAELAQILGISKNSVSNKMQRGTLPKPDLRLAATPCWYVSTVNEWLEDNKP